MRAAKAVLLGCSNNGDEARKAVAREE